MSDFETIVKAIIVAKIIYSIGEGVLAHIMDVLVGTEWRN